MISDIARVFQRVPAVMLAAPAIFLLPTLAEGLQHIAEFQLGMFADEAGWAEAGPSRVRMVFGIIKILSILYVSLWVSGYWFHDGKRASFLLSAREFLGLLAMLGFSALVILFVVAGGPVLAGFVQASGLPIPEEVLPFLPLIVLLLLIFPTQHLNIYGFGLFLGDETMTLARSRQSIRGQTNWMTMIVIVPIAPFMVLHYWLNYQIIGSGLAHQVAFLSLDALLVGVMALIMGNAFWAVYERALQISAEFERGGVKG